MRPKAEWAINSEGMRKTEQNAALIIATTNWILLNTVMPLSHLFLIHVFFPPEFAR